MELVKRLKILMSDVAPIDDKIRLQGEMILIRSMVTNNFIVIRVEGVRRE